jgi:iron complex outermembrane receptor protein
VKRPRHKNKEARMAGTKEFIVRRGKPAATTATAVGLLIAGSSALAIDSSPARAHVSAQAYDIPAGSVADALNTLADASGAQLLYDAALTRHLKTGGVAGKRTLDAALHELLAGTGLTYKIDPGSRSVSIILAQASTGTRNDASGARALPPIEISAARRTRAATPPRVTTPAPVAEQPPSNRNVSQPAGVSTTIDDLVSERATTNDTASLLRDVPGAFVYSAGGVSSLPVLDGLADDRLHVTVAGMPILSACANHMNPPLSYIDPSHVGNIQVYPGIVPVSVGGDSIGGAILVNPRAPAFAQPGQQILTKGEVGAFYRSNGNAYGGSLSATAATENFSVRYDGSYSRSEDYYAGGDFKHSGPAFAWTNNTIPFTRFGSLTPWLSGSQVGSTAYQAQNHDVSIALRHENHLLEFNLGFQHIPYQWYPNQRMDMTENRSIHGNIRYTGQYDWGLLEGQVYHQTVRHIMDFGEDKQYYYGSFRTILAPGMPMDTKAQTTGAKLNANINLSDRHILRVGGEYQQYRYNEWWPPSPAILPPGWAMGGMAPDTFININNGQRDRFDVFAELETRWNAQWLTQVGVRSDTVVMNAGPVHGYNTAYDTPLFPVTRFNNSDRGRTDQNWNVTAQATYTPSVTQTYSFGYSMKTRSPNLYERYTWSNSLMAMEMIGWFGDGNFYIGNLALKPEVAHTISVTADWRDVAGEKGLKLTPYFTYVSDYIDVQRCPVWVCGTSWMHNPYRTFGFTSLQFINQNARIFGADLSGHALLAKDTPLGDFTAKGVLSYVNGQNTVTGGNLYQIMPVNTKLSLEQKMGGWTNSVEAQLVGAKKNIEQVRNEVKTSAYALFNLRSSYEWKNVRIDVGIENLLNTLYYLPLGGAYLGQAATMSGPLPVAPAWGIAVPGMGRNFYVATNVKF